MLLVSLGLFTAAFVLSAVITPLARKLALAIDMVDRPGGRKAHAAPMPYLGGAAIAAAFLLTFSVLQYLLHSRLPGGQFSIFGLGSVTLGQWTPHTDPYPLDVLARLKWIAMGGVVIFGLGLIDDRRPLSPWAKLAVPGAVGAALASQGVSIDFYGPLVSTVLTVLWVVGITNAVNFLDNMDGLCAGFTVTASAVFFIVAAQTGQVAVALVCACLAGAAAGFLPYNFPRARIFMGDAGSLFLGYTLASLTMCATYYRYRPSDSILQLAMPVLVLGLPIFDSASVLWIRWRERRPLLQADRSHFSHRLVTLGMSPPEAVATNCLVALVVGLGAVLLYRPTPAETAGSIILVQAVGIFAIVALLDRAGRRKS